MSTPGTRPVSGWAIGFSAFAGAVMILIGIFHFFTGLGAVINDNLYVVGQNYAFDLDVTQWGWIHMILGVIIFAAGLGIFSGAPWARAVGITLAIISAIANFLFIPNYPAWAILFIALDIIVIWALASYHAVTEMILAPPPPSVDHAATSRARRRGPDAAKPLAHRPHRRAHAREPVFRSHARLPQAGGGPPSRRPRAVDGEPACRQDLPLPPP